ncbi:MAG: hypothetical protein A2Y74_09925 [Actinobacteria bacterium RBG_13_63_9]|nr:MAG: hypothetical protein A2Y74_09925 [Actinobacteria bacterium RBG_13_63_9]
MIYLDVDRHDLGPNWELDLLILYHDLRARFPGAEPRIRVSSRGGGWHIIIPRTLPLEQDRELRELYDCPGHAALTHARGGADIAFSRRGSQCARECADVWQAIDVYRGMH